MPNEVQHNHGPKLLIGIPTLGRPVPLEWAMAFKSMNPPINYNVNFSIIFGQEIGVARQALAEQAVSSGCKYLFFLGDDVECPGHTLRQLIYRMEQDPTIDVVGGVYVAKAQPAAPLVFRGNGQGTYWDWKVGEFFEVTGLGMDCTLIRVSLFERLSKPWFRTVDKDSNIDGTPQAESWTEDLFFLHKAAEEASARIFCDASVICPHWDVYNHKAWKLPKDSLPMRQKGKLKDKSALILGPLCPLADETYDVVHAMNTYSPDCDYRVEYSNLPFDKEIFDFVIVTEPLLDVDRFLPEFRRVAKSGAKIELNVHENLHPERMAERLGGKLDGSFVELVNGNSISN